MKYIPLLIYLLIIGAMLMMPTKAFAQSCTPSPSGDYSITTDCSFPGTINGVDTGSGNTNTATLTVSSGILTIAPDQQLAFGQIVIDAGVIALPTDNSAELLPGTAIWMSDADDDHYPETSTQVASPTPPNGDAKRRNTILNVNSIDCYGSSLAFPGQTQYFSTNRGDGSFDYNCDSAITKARDVCTCDCADGCLPTPVCTQTIVTESTACGTSGIDAGPSSCSRMNDIFGSCMTCTPSGSTTTTLVCR